MPNTLSTRKLPAGAIEASLGGLTVVLRERDGYVNATRLCKDGKKQFGHWNQLDKTSSFLECLSSVIGIPMTALMEISQGGDPSLQGTWVHPRVATNLAQWISPEYDVLVSGVMERFHRGDLTLAAEVVRQHDDLHDTDTQVRLVTRKRKERDPLEEAQLRYEVMSGLLAICREAGTLDAATLQAASDYSKNSLLLLTAGRADGTSQASPVTWSVVMRAQALGLRVSRKDWVTLGTHAVRAYRRRYGCDPRCGKKPGINGDTGVLVWHYTEEECAAAIDDAIRHCLNASV